MTESPVRSASDRFRRLTPTLLLLLCLGLNLWSVTRDFDAPLLGRHSFRKTQTAISTYYQIKDGFSLDYATPVLGAPWAIPMEFPLFQWAVAALVRATGMDLDQAGRLVSLFCFYCCLPAVFLLARRLSMGLAPGAGPVAPPLSDAGLATVCLLLVSPMYIFWSSTFMIESMALCLCLWRAWLLLRWRDAGRTSHAALALLFGVLAGLVKITTLLVFLAPEVCLAAWDGLAALRSGAWRRPQARWRLLCYALSLGIALLAAWLWTSHADAVKSQNPMAGFLLSSELKTWNFGSLEQRLAPRFWTWIGQALSNYGLGSWFLLLLLVPGMLRKETRAGCLLCLIGYIAGPLLFANLYFVHDYYHYAILVFPMLAVGLGVSALLETFGLRRIGPLLLGAVLFFPFSSYMATYYKEQTAPKILPAHLSFLREALAPDDVLLLYGEDWSSCTPYYAQRRALMNRSDLPLRDPRFQRAIELTGKERIAALLKAEPDPELNAFFGFSPNPSMPNVYLRADARQRAFLRLFGVDAARSSAGMPLMAYPFQGRLRLLSAPPARLVAPLPNGASELSFEYGLLQDAGPVRFRLLLVEEKDSAPTAPKTLFERVLSGPVMGARQERLSGLKAGPGVLLLETEALNKDEALPAFWSGLQVR